MINDLRCEEHSPPTQGVIMADTVARVTEISASSETSFEEALNVGIDRSTGPAI